MKQETILKIANYKQQLAELDRYYWFEDLDERFYQVNFDRLTGAIKELEND